MPTPENSETLFPKLSQAVTSLLETGRKLHDVMDEQISAIIAADAGKVEQLSESYSDLRGEFARQEELFIERLTEQMGAARGEADEETQSVRLEALKKQYPASAPVIEAWKLMLTQSAEQLKNKHEQLLHLLEFAIERNSGMMQSIYGMFNEKNTRYSPSGGKTGISSGVTINREI